MRDLLRQTILAAFLIFLIGGIWALGWAHSINERVDEMYSTPPPAPYVYEAAHGDVGWEPDAAREFDARTDTAMTSTLDPSDF